MTTLVAGAPFRSRTPMLTVENKLDPGAWIFRLVVVDDDGNESAPQDLTVGVRRAVIPTPTPTPTPTRPTDPRVIIDTPTPTPTRVDPRVVITPPVSPAPTTPTRPIDPRVIIRRPS